MRVPTLAFTSASTGKVNVLETPVSVAKAFKPVSDSKQVSLKAVGAKNYTAIWDTGATSTVITPKVAHALGLRPIGITEISTANDKKKVPLYLVSIFLPNQLCFPELTVAEATVAGNADILIGMDIIGRGDFAVTNHDGKTVFSFRTPSAGPIDFVKEEQAKKPLRYPGRHIGRNDPCPCGSGKKYKKCHGK